MRSAFIPPETKGEVSFRPQAVVGAIRLILLHVRDVFVIAMTSHVAKAHSANVEPLDVNEVDGGHLCRKGRSSRLGLGGPPPKGRSKVAKTCAEIALEPKWLRKSHEKARRAL